MSFAPEPAAPAGPGTAVLLCNLGSPDAPTAPALRRYLAQFLSDRRVIELPRALWWPILHGIVLRTRPARSAAKYARIWQSEGAPLKCWSERQAHLLAHQLGQAGHAVAVRAAMRYGQPAIALVLDELKAQGARRVLVLPLYPQYSGTSTASVADAVGAWATRQRRLPELRFVNSYHDHPGYIAALAHSLRRHWQQHGRAERLVVSFHGVPERAVTLGDPYRDQCLVSARALAQALDLREDQYLITFQSRFGKARWLTPATQPTLCALASAGTASVDVICPGFASDCLETLEEIDHELRAAFLAHGGREFRYVPCLNGDGPWIDALCALAQQHLAGWDTRPASLRAP